MGKPCSFVITRDFLYQAYCVEGSTVVEIARRIQCRTTTITNALIAHGLYQPVTQEWLQEQYMTLHRTIDEIASQLGCSEANVRAYLRKYGFPIKKRGKANIPQLNDAAWLYEHYVTNQLSSCQIADMLDCAESSVNHALHRFHIPRRPQPVAVSHRANYARRNFSSRKRRLIMKRDGHQCRMPGCTATSNLTVHHIVPVRERGSNAIENGITLCNSCHFLTFGKEAEYASLFQTIVTTPSGAVHLVSTPPA